MSLRLIALLVALGMAACSSSSKAKDTEDPEFHSTDNPIVQARLQARVDNIKYQRGVTLITNLERLAAYGHLAIPVCLEGIESEDAMTRMGCAWVLGRIGDTRAVPHLEGLLGDDVDFVRYEAAAQLGQIGSTAGYRVLVQGLEDEKLEYRFKCHEALRELTGKNFGYSHNASPELRAAAVKKWQQWVEDVESEDL
jgi:HEAT repeat protein